MKRKSNPGSEGRRDYLKLVGGLVVGLAVGGARYPLPLFVRKSMAINLRALRNLLKTPYLFVLPSLSVILLMFEFPFLYLLYMSLLRWDATTPIGGILIGAKNYFDLLTDQRFLSSIVKLFSLTIGSVSISLLLGLGVALLLNRSFRGKNVVRTLFVTPIACTPVVVAMSWKILLNPVWGLVNYFLSLVGIAGPTWLGSVSTALLSIMIMDVWQWTPFMILVMLAGLESLPVEPFEAAEIDGASKLQVFRYITMPFLKHVMMVALVFRAIDSLKTFDIIFATAKGGPGTATETLNILVFLHSFRFYNLGYGASIAVVLFAITMLMGMFFMKYVLKER